MSDPLKSIKIDGIALARSDADIPEKEIDCGKEIPEQWYDAANALTASDKAFVKELLAASIEELSKQEGSSKS